MNSHPHHVPRSCFSFCTGDSTVDGVTNPKVAFLAVSRTIFHQRSETMAGQWNDLTFQVQQICRYHKLITFFRKSLPRPLSALLYGKLQLLQVVKLMSKCQAYAFLVRKQDVTVTACHKTVCSQRHKQGAGIYMVPLAAVVMCLSASLASSASQSMSTSLS